MDFLKDSVILEVPTGNNHIHTTILITPDLSKVLRWYGVDGNFNIIDSKSGEVLYVYPNWTPKYFGSYAFSPDSKRFYMNATSNYFAKVTLDTFSVKTKVAKQTKPILNMFLISILFITLKMAKSIWFLCRSLLLSCLRLFHYSTQTQ